MNSQSSARLGLRADGPVQGRRTANLNSTPPIFLRYGLLQPAFSALCVREIKGPGCWASNGHLSLVYGRAVAYRCRELGWFV
jgi:hypothetical protein